MLQFFSGVRGHTRSGWREVGILGSVLRPYTGFGRSIFPKKNHLNFLNNYTRKHVVMQV